MNELFLKNILLEYQKKRDLAEKRSDFKKKDLYSKIPQIEEIDDQIRKIGFDMVKLVLKNPTDKEKICLETKNKINSLQNEKSKLYKLYNIPDDYIDVKYECSICKDRGFLDNGDKCNCLKQKIINEVYNMSNISKILENQPSFDLSIFSDEIDDGHKISPRQNMQNILSICDDFIFNFDKNDSLNLLFYGQTGLGKTFMSSYIAREILDKGYTVIYQTAFKMFDIIKDYQFRTDESSIKKEDYDNLFDCDLLIIDDLGTELTNSFTVSELFIILNTRLINNKKTIISTNYDIYQIAEVYTQRIFSRIFDKFKAIEFIGKDVRWESKISNLKK
ncbi:MAG: ATP-binding protein [Terrisporobacter othiniensis]|uniref:ATP-binding protein n=1 Tax=Terrisporobacter othiniensis TaxID=1577792 RepID=UPI002A74A77E|nr:ATP-binding protein [Terrisporobacter othiniensis]MDY3372210.1 ATP-binding protein [Terrisporobacter othiniensis]